MHVVQYRNVPGGFRSPVLRRFYDEALAGGLYPPDAFLMTNPIEFFGVTASCYLNGTIAREPFSRAAIRERQPGYYAFLSRLFGPRGDVAEGSAADEVANR